MEVVASLSQGRTAAAQCGLFTYKSVPVIFEPSCIKGRIILKVHIGQDRSHLGVLDKRIMEVRFPQISKRILG